ncbi:MAG: gliding motility protein GldC [Leptospiraceae bacterium]|nr:gliding motility protein GldC [Leptospiraceae bacterium]
MAHRSEIKIIVELDNDSVPDSIFWEAKDAGEEMQASEAFILSLYDADKKEALGIDLWSKEMQVPDMGLFYYQTLRRMADTFERATKETENAQMIRDFAREFGKKIGLIKK